MKVNILKFIMLFFALACLYFIIETGRVLLKTEERLYDFAELKRLNQELFLQIDLQSIHTTIEESEDSITKINAILDKISSNFITTKLFYKLDHILFLENLNAKIKKQTDIIRNYYVIRQDISKCLIELNQNLSKTTNIKEMSNAYALLMNSRFIDEFDRDSFDIYLTKLIAQEQSPFDYQFLSMIQHVNDNLITIPNLQIQNYNMHIQRQIQELIKISIEYFNSALYALIGSSAFLLIIVILAVAKNGVLNLQNKENKLKLKQLRHLIDSNPNQVIILDKFGKISSVNNAFVNASSFSAQSIIGKELSSLNMNMQGIDIFDEVSQSKEIKCYDEFVSKSNDGILIYENIVAIPMLDEFNDINGAIILKQDITKERLIKKELNFRNSQLQESSIIDNLTGLKNLSALNDAIKNNQDGVLIYMMITDFANLRFFYRSDFIDMIFIAIANSIKLAISTYKIDAIAYRMQLDEFCIWYKGDNIKKDIKYILEYFKSKNITIQTDGGFEILPNISITMGISSNSDKPNLTRLTQGILAAQEAKEKELSFSFYNHDNIIEKSYQKNATITRLIQYALNENRVIVECQGIFDIRNSKPTISSYEILIRILDQQNQIHYPNEFLSVAKLTSLYLALTKQVINRAFELLERFGDKKRFSINLSSVDMLNEPVKNLFLQKLSLCQNPQNLTIEILESEGVDDYNAINPFIQEIKNYGCKLSLDDFGSGYSNYYRMLELNIDYIKIDGSIISKLPFDKNAKSVVTTIVEFAKRQGYETVAEFVSTPQILDIIKEVGIDYAQGYLLARPVLPNNIE
ncbi:MULTISPECIES: sensor domain-containing phosphodiesterase [Campylobacter]|uniref:sensor domain-containing phosphodiesterase n=1 Tax=Campylobacter TaxID=194 RepID=UPI000A348340|nr:MULTISPECIES: EAL domain-containing protein [unclassified Campylobacter]MCR8696066.1 EAL domain-containing protein [Campylobacter sp. RM19073]